MNFFTVWIEGMLPVLNQKNFANFVVQYLENLLRYVYFTKKKFITDQHVYLKKLVIYLIVYW